MMEEISLQRAQQLYLMMQFLKSTGKYNIFYDSTYEGMCEVYRLRDSNGHLIGEVELRFNKYYHRDV